VVASAARQLLLGGATAAVSFGIDRLLGVTLAGGTPSA
jgi:hypothetical protein